MPLFPVRVHQDHEPSGRVRTPQHCVFHAYNLDFYIASSELFDI